MTEYIEYVKNGGKDFTEFVMKGIESIERETFCKYGAGSDGLPLMKIESQYGKDLEFQKKKLEDLRNTTPEETEKLAEKAYLDGLKEKEKTVDRYSDYMKFLEYMIKKMKEWEIPTDDHMSFKNNLQTRLQMELQDSKYNRNVFDSVVIKKLTGDQWLRQQMKNTLAEIECIEGSIEEESEKIEKHMKWYKQLKESLDETY